MSKVIQLNKVNAPVTVNAAKAGVSTDVSSLGPLTIAVQIVTSGAAAPVGTTAVLQGSLDGVNFFNIGTPTVITTNTVVVLAATSVEYKVYRVNYARSSGSIVSTEQIMVYGDKA